MYIFDALHSILLGEKRNEMREDDKDYCCVLSTCFPVLTIDETGKHLLRVTAYGSKTRNDVFYCTIHHRVWMGYCCELEQYTTEEPFTINYITKQAY